MFSARHCRGPALALLIAYCTASGIARPNHTQMGQKTPKPVTAQITTITKTISPENPSCIVCTTRQSISLRGSSMYSLSMVSSIARPEARLRWGAMASHTEAVPTPATIARRCLPLAAAPPSRKPRSNSAPERR